MVSPRLGIVTVSYNSAHVLPAFLATIAAQRDVVLTLVVVDNASSDDSVALVERAREDGLDVHLVRHERNHGLARANNVGIAACLERGVDWIALMNNDTASTDVRLLARLCAEASARGALAASPVIAMTDPPDAVWFAGAEIRRWRGHQVKHRAMGRPLASVPGEAHRTEHLPACCLLLRPEAVERVGAVDEEFFVYGEDVDYSLRLADAGVDRWVLSAASGVLVHEHSSVTGGFLSDFTCHWLTRNWVLVHRKRTSGPRLVVGLAYVQLWILARLLARRERLSHFLLRQRGFRAGLRAPTTGGRGEAVS